MSAERATRRLPSSPPRLPVARHPSRPRRSPITQAASWSPSPAPRSPRARKCWGVSEIDPVPSSTLNPSPHPSSDAASGRSLVVSLHDVSPHTWTPCVQILDELRAIGVGAVSLLVIPDHHHRGHFLGHEEFCRWLRTQIAIGHEAVIHGYHHERAARTGETLRERMITHRYTAGEGEFF